jgi:hypothetical protein
VHCSCDAVEITDSPNYDVDFLLATQIDYYLKVLTGHYSKTLLVGDYIYNVCLKPSHKTIC